MSYAFYPFKHTRNNIEIIFYTYYTIENTFLKFVALQVDYFRFGCIVVAYMMPLYNNWLCYCFWLRIVFWWFVFSMREMYAFESNEMFIQCSNNDSVRSAFELTTNKRRLTNWKYLYIIQATKYFCLLFSFMCSLKCA